MSEKAGEDFLAHYGVLGMKWGRRKNSSGSYTTTGRKAKNKYESKDSKAVRKLRKKKLNQLSNDELKKLNNRLQLEKQFKELKRSDTSAGKKFVQELLISTGKSAAQNLVSKGVNSAINVGLGAAAGKASDPTVAAILGGMAKKPKK